MKQDNEESSEDNDKQYESDDKSETPEEDDSLEYKVEITLDRFTSGLLENLDTEKL